jgi:hypothetical protein
MNYAWRDFLPKYGQFLDVDYKRDNALRFIRMGIYYLHGAVCTSQEYWPSTA